MYGYRVITFIFVPNWYIIYKGMLVISSREFRQNQKKYFEKVDKGEHIIVQRAKDKAYALTPISEDDMYFNAKMVDKIKQSILEVKQGEVQKVSTSKEISDLLGL
jgi:antitoxin YefM